MEGGESQGSAAPGEPELLKKADISLMYFTAAERGRENYIKQTGRLIKVQEARQDKSLENDYGTLISLKNVTSQPL